MKYKIKLTSAVNADGRKKLWQYRYPHDKFIDMSIGNIYRAATQFDTPTLFPKVKNGLGGYGFVLAIPAKTR